MRRKHTHIGCYGIITSNNKIALIKKARGGYLGKLDLPGGGIEHNESPEDTLKRELNSVLNSRSWKITKPLRAFSNFKNGSKGI